MIPLIVNPAAGGGRAASGAASWARDMEAAGHPVRLHPTTHAGHAGALATELGREAAKAGLPLLCAGGDGTTYEVLQGVMALARADRPALGTVPMGTGNSFLRDFGVTTPAQMAEAVKADRRHPVDVVEVVHDKGTLHYLNLFGIGFVSDVGLFTNRHLKSLGPAGYAVATVVEVARLHTYDVPFALDEAPTDHRPLLFVSFSNSQYTGGAMRMAPGASVSDGLVDVVRVGPMSRSGLLRAFPSIYQGTHVHHPDNEVSRARQVTFHLDGPVDVMVDGEVLRCQPQILTVLPAAVQVIA